MPPRQPNETAAMLPSAFSLQELLDALAQIPLLTQRILNIETHITHIAHAIDKPTDRLMNREQAAQYLNISTRHFDRLRQDPGIPNVTLGKGAQFLQSDLDALIAKLKTNPQPFDP